MSHSHCQSFQTLGMVPPLSAIIHDSNPTSFDDGFFLPSSYHSRTWLLDNFEETCHETTTKQLTDSEQDQSTMDPCMQSSCSPRVVQTTCSNSKSCEKPSCQFGISPATSKCMTQLCQSQDSQKMGFRVQKFQPARYMTKCCPLKTSVSESCQTVEYKSSQCHSNILESSSCSTLGKTTPGQQILESSSTYEPTCCVTGGLQLPSK